MKICLNVDLSTVGGLVTVAARKRSSGYPAGGRVPKKCSDWRFAKSSSRFCSDSIRWFFLKRVLRLKSKNGLRQKVTLDQQPVRPCPNWSFFLGLHHAGRNAFSYACCSGLLACEVNGELITLDKVMLRALKSKVKSE